jgi:hypothetical protein
MNTPSWRLHASLFAIAVAATLSGCATMSGPRAADRCVPPAESLESAPARKWMEEQAWRFASADAAAAAYFAQLRDSSPWPDWYPTQEMTLAIGTRFQMAVSRGQAVDQPGGFGTFDNISDVADVRSSLAVKSEWKPDVDRVVVYEVTQPLRVRIGPVGPQVDARACQFLPGRWSQLEMLVRPPERMNYLRVIDVRSIR